MNILKRNKPIFIIMYCIMIISVVISASYAWYCSTLNRKGYTNNLEIEDPPILYILDSDATDMKQLSLTGLKIGVHQQIVFCISNVYPVSNDQNGYKGAFSLQLAYTNNLKADYNLYSAERVPNKNENSKEFYSQKDKLIFCNINNTQLTYDSKNDIGNETSYGDNYTTSLNKATYKTFEYTNDNSKPNNVMSFSQSLSQVSPEYDTSKCLYFVLDISWSENTNVNTIDPKETDLIYIIARGSNN